jgi:NAD(P)-dependent dehydrogenase (short-subunit alcohol dehydrogenase family)
MTDGSWTEADIPDLHGRVAVVTGANSGLGLETARQLAAHGATVVLAVRSLERGASAIDDIRSTVGDATLELQQLDLGSFAAIRTAADELRTTHDRIDLLVNNAGVMNLERELTADGFELQFGTNHLGHFLFTTLLLDRMLPVPGSRVVTVSSLGHWAPLALDLDDIRCEQGYSPARAYTRSKLSNLLFAYELHRRLVAAGACTASLAAHPGGSDTDVARHIPGLDRVRPWMQGLAQTAAQGALPTLRAATDPAASSGQYFGPDGFIESRGYPIVVRSSRRSQDRRLQARLWALSEELTGAPSPI